MKPEDRVLVADIRSPQQMRFYIYREGPGWMVLIQRLVDGEWEPVEDVWEERASQVPNYPARHVIEADIRWIDEESGEVADLADYLRESAP